MDEKTTGTIQAKENSREGDIPTTTNIIDEARSIREGLNKDIAELRTIKNDIEQAVARMVISGKSNAGTVQKDQATIDAETMQANISARMKRLGLKPF